MFNVEDFPGLDKLRDGLFLVTPAAASVLLGLIDPDQQRPVSKAVVDEYAGTMRLGKWVYNPDAVCITLDGKLKNGQHRLHAIKKSGVAVPLEIRVDVPDSSIQSVDIGRRRTLAHIAKFQGFLSADNSTMAIARWLCGPGGMKQGFNPRYAKSYEILEVAYKHKKAIQFSRPHGSASVKLSSVRAAIAKAYYHVPVERLSQFCTVLDSGFSNGTPDSAAVSLRNLYFGSWRGKSANHFIEKKGKNLDFVQHNLALNAIQRFCGNENVKGLGNIVSDPYWPLPTLESLNSDEAA